MSISISSDVTVQWNPTAVTGSRMKNRAARPIRMNLTGKPLAMQPDISAIAVNPEIKEAVMQVPSAGPPDEFGRDVLLYHPDKIDKFLSLYSFYIIMVLTNRYEHWEGFIHYF
jgi:hypothetical protein